MTALWFVLPVVAALAAAAAWWVARRPLEHVLRDRLRSVVLVTLKSTDTYRGVLYEADREVLVLRSAEALSPDGSRLSVDGELLILRADVAYIQRP